MNLYRLDPNKIDILFNSLKSIVIDYFVGITKIVIQF